MYIQMLYDYEEDVAQKEQAAQEEAFSNLN
jgi:hypothetical protein